MNNKVNGNEHTKMDYSKISIISAVLPIAILISGYLFCLILAGGGTSDNDSGAIWWLFVFLILIMIPVTIIANILSVVFGIKGLKIKKTIFAWIGIIIVLVELFSFPLIYGVDKLSNMPEYNARQQELLELKNEIADYESYVDLTSYDLGLYKLEHEGDKYLWDVTKPEDTVINYNGVDMVYENCINRRDSTSFDYHNEGKNVDYDVYFYDNTYIIVTPIWDKPDTLDYLGDIYFCKELNTNVDLFSLRILDPESAKQLNELSSKKYTRKELTEKLGKTF